MFNFNRFLRRTVAIQSRLVETNYAVCHCEWDWIETTPTIVIHTVMFGRWRLCTCIAADGSQVNNKHIEFAGFIPCQSRQRTPYWITKRFRVYARYEVLLVEPYYVYEFLLDPFKLNKVVQFYLFEMEETRKW